MTDRDPLAEALTLLVAPPLDPRFLIDVGACAKAELRPPARSAPGVARLRLAVSAGLVPALLTLAAVVATADAASTIAKIYGKAQDVSSQ
ncbi:MAG TPA: hypothetical protein VK540_35670 [Polyangiaceae bacterium]|nr:hypothetical protein [Polyangiaceae bacterium]